MAIGLHRRRLLAAALALPGVGMASTTPQWPARTVTIVVSYPPGGDTDAIARIFAHHLTRALGVPVIVENRPGASGTIGNASVARAKPDGHTLLATPSTLTTSSLVLGGAAGRPGYDVTRDFEPIMQFGTQSLFLFAYAGSGLVRLEDLVQRARKGAQFSYATPGTGSPMHILGELFNRSAGIAMAQVPYRGTAPSIPDVVAGHVPLLFSTLGPASQYVAAGKLVPLAVGDDVRSPLLGAVPTFAERNFRDVRVTAWQALVGPRGMPAEVVASLNRICNQLLALDEVRAGLLATSTVPVGGSPGLLRDRIDSDHAHFADVVRELKIRVD